MSFPTITPVSFDLYFLKIVTRVPLKFGPETVTSVTCARVRAVVADEQGKTAVGWGETPLSVQWVWPSALPYDERHEALKSFTIALAREWSSYSELGHPIELSIGFQHQVLPGMRAELNKRRVNREPMPHLAALVACSAFDLALHDAFGNLLGKPTFETVSSDYLNNDLAHFMAPAKGSGVSFENRFPSDYLTFPRPHKLVAWHLVGGMDAVDESELRGDEPSDGYPVLLRDWIKRDGLSCLKVKLRGDDADWDFERLKKVGRISIQENVQWLSADFNCTVQDPSYVCEILDKLMRDEPRIYGMLLYVEQPFPYDLEAHAIDVRSVSGASRSFSMRARTIGR